MPLTVPSPVGPLTLTERDGFLVRIEFLAGPCMDETPLLLEAARQLTAYFRGELRHFDLPLAPQGTPFQRAVWDALCAIPYGETRAYSDLAQAVGRPRACRAVGQANHVNPLPIVIPCHRVVGRNGTLTGYAGGLAVKQTLLRLEKSFLCDA